MKLYRSLDGIYSFHVKYAKILLGPFKMDKFKDVIKSLSKGEMLNKEYERKNIDIGT